MKKESRIKLIIRFFNLMEMVIVIAIIALLATIVTPVYFKKLSKAKMSTAKTQIQLLDAAVLDFRIDTGKLPSSLDDLSRNTSGDKKWDGPYLKGAVPKDPWGNDYVYVIPGTHGEFDIISYGSDNQPGGDSESADIGNWNESSDKNG
ncbi:MAG: type II secretion system protein GspG [Lentisphaerae bacterium GWF2_45_14]|nr:MAG: type II secretion system protein GspG [Lentisphaerae bacterium GWF2_45_14]